MRTRRFLWTVRVSLEMLRQGGDRARDSIVAAARAEVEGMEVFTGPRGGRYAAFGPVDEGAWGVTESDWGYSTITYQVSRMGRYVRPSVARP